MSPSQIFYPEIYYFIRTPKMCCSRFNALCMMNKFFPFSFCRMLLRTNVCWPPCVGVWCLPGSRDPPQTRCNTAPATAAVRIYWWRSRTRCTYYETLARPFICFMQLACLVPCAGRLTLTKVSMSSWRTPCLKDNAAWSWLMVFMNGRSRIRASSPSSYTSLRLRGWVRRKQGTRMNPWPHSAARRIQRPNARQRRPPLIWQRFVWGFLLHCKRHWLVLLSRPEIEKRQLWRKLPPLKICCVGQ